MICGKSPLSESCRTVLWNEHVVAGTSHAQCKCIEKTLASPKHSVRVVSTKRNTVYCTREKRSDCHLEERLPRARHDHKAADDAADLSKRRARHLTYLCAPRLVAHDCDAVLVAGVMRKER